MQSSKTIHVVSCHAEGEVGDVIVGGVQPPPGDTLWQQARWIQEDQTLRNFVLNEPRGGVFRHVNLLVPPKDPRAQMGWIIMEPEHTPPMSGSNSMCVTTVLLETGILPMTEPVTHLVLEAPGGLVEVEAQCINGKVKKVKVQNVPSFAASTDAHLEVTGIGTLCVDTAYGGDSFVMVNAKDLGFSLVPDEARDMAEMSIPITRAANEQLGFHHPTNPDWKHISFCQLLGELKQLDSGQFTMRNTVVIEPGKLDRSPCGTGVSARMSVLHHKGIMQKGDRLKMLSPIDSVFDGCIEDTILLGDQKAIIPSIAGRGFITGAHQHMLDPGDPWPEGYRLSDTWPNL